MAGDDTVVRPIIEGPDEEGFHGVRFNGDGHNGQYGRMLCRAESEHSALVRIETGQRSSSVRDALHGGFMLSFLDQALFVGSMILCRVELPWAVTLGVSTQFLAAGNITTPLDCLVEIVKETGRLLFIRGTMEQAGEVKLTYQATVRKLTPHPV